MGGVLGTESADALWCGSRGKGSGEEDAKTLDGNNDVEHMRDATGRDATATRLTTWNKSTEPPNKDATLRELSAALLQVTDKDSYEEELEKYREISPENPIVLSITGSSDDDRFKSLKFLEYRKYQRAFRKMTREQFACETPEFKKKLIKWTTDRIPDIPVPLVEFVAELFDVDFSGHVTLEEYIMTVTIFNMSKQRVGRAAEVAKLFHIFHFLDTNESGHIDEHEMKTFIQRCHSTYWVHGTSGHSTVHIGYLCAICGHGANDAPVFRGTRYRCPVCFVGLDMCQLCFEAEGRKFGPWRKRNPDRLRKPDPADPDPSKFAWPKENTPFVNREHLSKIAGNSHTHDHFHSYFELQKKAFALNDRMPRAKKELEALRAEWLKMANRSFGAQLEDVPEWDKTVFSVPCDAHVAADDQFKQLMKLGDTDSDGMISWEEFQNFGRTDGRVRMLCTAIELVQKTLVHKLRIAKEDEEPSTDIRYSTSVTEDYAFSP